MPKLIQNVFHKIRNKKDKNPGIGPENQNPPPQNGGSGARIDYENIYDKFWTYSSYLGDQLEYSWNYLVDTLSSLFDSVSTSEADRAQRQEFNEREIRKRELEKQQNKEKQRRTKLINKNENMDLAQLNRELATCEQWHKDQVWVRELVSKTQRSETFDPDGNLINPDYFSLVEGQSHLNQARIEDLCRELKRTEQNLFYPKPKGTPSNLPQLGGITPSDDPGLMIDQEVCNKRVENLKTRNEQLTESYKLCSNRILELENQSQYDLKNEVNRLNDVIKNMTADQNSEGILLHPSNIGSLTIAEIQQLIDRSKANAMDPRRLQELRKLAGIKTDFEKALSWLVDAFLWPTYLLRYDCAIWKSTNNKLTFLERFLAAAIASGLYYTFLYRCFNAILDRFLKKREPKIELKNGTRLSRTSSAALKRFRGGYQNTIDLSLALDPIFLAIHLNKASRIVETFKSEENEENEAIYSSNLQSNLPEEGQLNKKTSKIGKILNTVKGFGSAILGSEWFLFVIGLILRILADQYLDKKSQQQNPLKLPTIEPSKPPIERLLFEEVEKVEENKLPVSEKKSTKKIKPRVPLSERTQTIAGLKSQDPVNEDNIEKESSSSSIQIQLPDNRRLIIRNKIKNNDS